MAKSSKQTPGENEIHVGTSGWSYKHWIKRFYPEELKSAEWLPFYAEKFACTEINASFYRIPKKETVEKWAATVPADFLFCPKLSRYITHIKRLNDPEEPLDYFFEVFAPMQHKMGPVLIQLPPSLTYDRDKASHFFKLLHRKFKSYRFALEGRHPSWLEPNSIEMLKEFDIAFVMSHSEEKFPYSEFITSKNIYVRFHGPKKIFASRYEKRFLKKFANKMITWKNAGHSIWAFFNNDGFGYALKNAEELIDLSRTNKEDLKKTDPHHRDRLLTTRRKKPSRKKKTTSIK